jgi:predicted AAA+ superfamily ATPase
VDAKYHEFIRHRGGDTNLSPFSFSEFCTLEEPEFSRTDYMKDVVLYEAVPTKFGSSFLEQYCIFYEFSNFMNGQ